MLIQIFNGLVYGGLLYIVSVGLVLIFGLRRVVNFAHGTLFMIGAYVGYSASAVGGFWFGAFVSIFVLAALGALLDMFVFRPLQNENPVVTVLVTFGLLLIGENAATTIWGKDMLTLSPPALLTSTIAIGDAVIPTYRIMVVLVAVAVAAILGLWLRHSRVGLHVRASNADALTTGILGVNTDRLGALVVAIGAGLAGLSGTIAAPLMALSPTMGGSILIDSFIVVVTGGLGSFTGAFIAAILIGQLHNFGVVLVPQVASMIPFVLMIVVLIWRPTGLSRTTQH
jgi:branched-chain amino acid transport system permease protein